MCVFAVSVGGCGDVVVGQPNQAHDAATSRQNVAIKEQPPLLIAALCLLHYRIFIVKASDFSHAFERSLNVIYIYILELTRVYTYTES